MIKVTNLKKHYINKTSKFGFFTRKKIVKKAVDGIDLYIKPGEIIGLLGINGAGKTTTIKMLSTLLKPSEGEIFIDGENYSGNLEKIKSQINMIAGGERMLYFRLTGYQNLEYFGSLYGMKKKELNDRIEYLLTKLNLMDVKDVPVERYSKGMKQRLSIARGLINNPKYIFLDEPTLGLDVHVARDLRKYITTLAKEEGKGILLTSHYLDEVEELCDRIYVLKDGKVLIEEKTNDLIKNLSVGITIQFTIKNMSELIKNKLINFTNLNNGDIEFINDQNIDHDRTVRVITKKDISIEIIQLLLKNNTKIGSFNIEKPNLENVILNLEKEDVG